MPPAGSSCSASAERVDCRTGATTVTRKKRTGDNGGHRNPPEQTEALPRLSCESGTDAVSVVVVVDTGSGY